MPEVKLVSSEGKEVLVDQEVAKKSLLIKNIIDDTGIQEQIYLPNIKENTLKKILQYCSHYRATQPQEIPKPLPQPTLEGLVDGWDLTYINMQINPLLELLLAANYMDIRGLLQLSCAKLASNIKGKKVEQLRAMFGIQSDFTPEEQAQIREENKWAYQL